MHILLDKYLCEKYPLIFADRNKSMSESCMHWGLDVGNGWFYIIDNLCKTVQSHIDSHNKCVDSEYDWAVKIGKIKQVVALQVKEKFSGLRFYYSGGDERIRGMFDLAESLSYDICEDCGILDDTVGRNSKGWIVTTCKKHSKNKKDFKFNSDEKLNKIWETIRKNEKKTSKTKVQGDMDALDLMIGKQSKESKKHWKI